MYEICRHLLASGRRCTQPAVHDTSFCRHHGVVKRTVADSVLPPKFYGLHRALPFLYPEDRAAIQANCFLVMRALDDRRINTQTANALTRLLRTCQMNLARGPLHEADIATRSAKRKKEESADASSRPALNDDPGLVQRVILTSAGEEVAPARTVCDPGEEQHHGEECPCRLCAQKYRGAAPEQHHAECRCGDCPRTANGEPLKPDSGLPGEQKPSVSSVPSVMNPSSSHESDAREETQDDDWKQEGERRMQIMQKHEDRLHQIEKQYQNSPELGERITEAVQEIMERELGPEAFSYPLHPSPAQMTAA